MHTVDSEDLGLTVDGHSVSAMKVAAQR
jgi:hypothetical protein